MTSVLRILSSVVIGMLCGAIIVGLFFWADSWFGNSSTGWGGSSRNWARPAAIIGAFSGAFLGAIIGLIVGIINANNVLWGAMVGAIIGVAIIALLLLSGPSIGADDVKNGAMIVSIGAVLGLITAFLLKHLWGLGESMP